MIREAFIKRIRVHRLSAGSFPFSYWKILGLDHHVVKSSLASSKTPDKRERILRRDQPQTNNDGDEATTQTHLYRYKKRETTVRIDVIQGRRWRSDTFGMPSPTPTSSRKTRRPICGTFETRPKAQHCNWFALPAKYPVTLTYDQLDSLEISYQSLPLTAMADTSNGTTFPDRRHSQWQVPYACYCCRVTVPYWGQPRQLIPERRTVQRYDGAPYDTGQVFCRPTKTSAMTKIKCEPQSYEEATFQGWRRSARSIQP
jgi:hypothetical protein